MLSKKLQKLVNQNLLTEEQAEKIMAAEMESKKSFAWKTLFIIAGLFIGFGIILLISANWDAIPAALKLCVDFAIFGGIIYALYCSIINNKHNLKELFIILSVLMVGGTIGLIAQTFNLSGGWQSFAVSWALLSTPFILVSRLLAPNIFWLLLLGCGIDWYFVKEFLSSLKYPLSAFIVLTIAFGLFSYAGTELYKACKGRIVLPKAFAKLSCFMMYYCAIFGGSYSAFIASNGEQMNYLPSRIFVFTFLAIRIALAFIRHNLSSFKNNAILAECYIVWVFIHCFNSLFYSGIGLISVGLLLLLTIYVLKKTSVYIKNMEIFHEQ